jgi:hypothetical protein
MRWIVAENRGREFLLPRTNSPTNFKALASPSPEITGNYVCLPFAIARPVPGA